jgi:hypothetical protein
MFLVCPFTFKEISPTSELKIPCLTKNFHFFPPKKVEIVEASQSRATPDRVTLTATFTEALTKTITAFRSIRPGRVTGVPAIVSASLHRLRVVAAAAE